MTLNTPLPCSCLQLPHVKSFTSHSLLLCISLPVGRWGWMPLQILYSSRNVSILQLLNQGFGSVEWKPQWLWKKELKREKALLQILRIQYFKYLSYLLPPHPHTHSHGPGSSLHLSLRFWQEYWRLITDFPLVSFDYANPHFASQVIFLRCNFITSVSVLKHYCINIRWQWITFGA